MNRAERRRQERQLSKQGRVQISINQIKEEVKKEVQTEIFQKSMMMLMSVPISVLRKEFGFGGKRLEKFGNAMVDELLKIQNEEIDPKQVTDNIEKETGLRILGLWEDKI